MVKVLNWDYFNVPKSIFQFYNNSKFGAWKILFFSFFRFEFLTVLKNEAWNILWFFRCLDLNSEIFNNINI